MNPAERDARRNGGAEISPAAAAALMASYSTPRGITAAAARKLAAQLIRCMDSRDTRAAEAIAVRLGGSDLDAVTAWVWRIEAGRAARRRVYRASPAWRTPRDLEWPAAALDEVIAIVAGVVSLPESPRGRPRGRPRAAEDQVQAHGTRAAWRRHRYHGERPCMTCLTGDGERQRKADQRAAA